MIFKLPILEIIIIIMSYESKGSTKSIYKKFNFFHRFNNLNQVLATSSSTFTPLL
jgi:hypothetical protein